MFGVHSGLVRGGPDASKCPEKTLDDISGKTENTRVFFDIEIDGEATGRIEFELFVGMTPLTADNFLQLCCGKGRGGYGYKGSRFSKSFGNGTPSTEIWQ